MVAQQKAEAAYEKEMAEKLKKLADTTDMQQEDYAMLEQLKQVRDKQIRKEKRLGLQS